MRRSFSLLALSFAVTAATLAPLTASAQPTAAEQETFFEQKVRPLLVRRCTECHGEKKQEGDVRLDSGVAVRRPSSSGAPVVPGKPDESRLLQVVAYKADDTQMPPAGKLPEEEIAILKTWVETGAFWPAHDPANAKAKQGLPRKADGSIDFEKASQQHWAYQPVHAHPLPAVKAADRCETPVDRWVVSQLEANGLALSPEADRATLVRRLSFDLRGLPPSFDEVQQFLADTAPDAYSRLVDRFLDSPEYGERWGRHWLDVARYADTKGYVFTQERRYPYAYTYRDYVVDSLNSDKPYDRFLMEQIAADQLGLKGNDPALAGLGLLTVGRRYLNNEQDIIDDRIDVVTRGLMGTTVACARCHDHKFDPLLAADYYGLYGVFSSSREPEELPLIGEQVETPEFIEFKKQRDERQQEIDKYIAEQHVALTNQARDHVADYFVAVVVKQGKAPANYQPKYQHGNPREKLVERWREYLERRVPAGDHLFTPWKMLAGLTPEEFEAKAPKILEELAAKSSTPTDPLVLNSLIEAKPKSLVDVAAVYGRLVNESREAWQKFSKENPQAKRLLEDSREKLRQVVYVAGTPPMIPLAEAQQKLFERDQRDRMTELKRKVDELAVESRGAPARAMVMVDTDKPNEPVIFERGNPGRRGPHVPRRFLRILSAADEKFQKGSGRLELAQSIASADNPLTARVIANRMWMHHFGKGLVLTPGDWGVRCEKPSHPELLDLLASRLVGSGWSLKSLHRDILLSATYRQASADSVDGRTKDPENRLMWRQNRRRLEFESMRDALLQAAGKLDPTMQGRPVNIESEPYSGRRSVYAFIDRNNFSALLRTFDYPTPDTSSSQRPETTVPQQALFELNSRFVGQMAEGLAARARATADAQSPSAVVETLYRAALSRSPSAEESQLAAAYLDGSPERLQELAQILMATNEFLFVD